MRLHQLEVTAFGPFADTVTVDFDELSDAGLFLLTGPTGAGKSSVLDAVCFALYGEVPGDRGGAKRLRSDHAAADVAPRVVLELSLAGRRFRIQRSPSWDRAKKRGTGTTRVQPSVLVAEQRADEWVVLATRLDEAGQLVSGLLGMSLAQFTQVALLPQGRFMAFLRAGSEERLQLLQRLFRTGRFADAERWLRDRRLELRRESEAHHQVVADLASRLSEADEQPLPDRWDPSDLTPAADDGSLRWWSEGLRACAERARREAERAELTCRTAEQRSRAALDEGRDLAVRLARRQAAETEQVALLDAAQAHIERSASVDRARRALAIAPVGRLAEAARASATQWSARVDTARAAVGAPTADLVEAADLVRVATGRVALARSLGPLEARLAQIVAERPDLQAQRDRLVARQSAVGGRVTRAPGRLVALRDGVALAERSAALVPSARERRQRLEAASSALVEVARIQVQVASARTAWITAGDEARSRQETWLDVREARLEGMAAEIASGLVVGGSCPVCGSGDHPRKALAAPGAPDAAAERSARRDLDDAKVVQHLRDEEHRGLLTRLAGAEARAGDLTPATVAEQLAAARAELADLETGAALLPAASQELARAELELEEARTQLTELARQIGDLDTRHAAAVEETRRLRAELEGALAETGAADTAALLSAANGLQRRAQELYTALQGWDLAREAEDRAAAACARAIHEHGFDTWEDAHAALLPEAELARVTREVEDHERRLAAVAEILAEPGADSLVGVAPPDLDLLESDLTRDIDRLGRVRADLGRWATRTDRLTTLVGDLDRALALWAPLRAELDLVTSVSSLVEGKSADNRWQMRLSAYVLASRLSQVVAAANERLQAMSDQRYALEHTGIRGVGETRGGLSLLVRDDWSGERRDPATLSGGETFVVSLALALGLADVISAEAGGVELDTLFVDEGFGSLDADTLDDVMDTLDGLRDGGRVVGVVSHVAEMRDRIPTQLAVTKARSGSQVSVRTG